MQQDLITSDVPMSGLSVCMAMHFSNTMVVHSVLDLQLRAIPCLR